MKILYQPQFPVHMRYQWWHYLYLERVFDKHFHSENVITLGKDFISDELNSDATKYDKQNFSPINRAIELENIQSIEYMQYMQNIPLSGDILYCSDLSFPGFFSNVLYHKRPMRSFAYCHATSINKFDYFENVSHSKWLCEMGHSKMFDKIFVGSKYHADKLGWKNVEVVGLPKPPFCTYKEEKIYDVISVARPCVQKVSSIVEDRINAKWPIIRKQNETWGDYYKFLSQAKILLISAKEDTFNYSILEAVMNNTIVLAPYRCSYPELLPREYIWENVFDLQEKIEYYLDHYKEVPKLLNEELVDNFYENVINIMTI